MAFQLKMNNGDTDGDGTTIIWTSNDDNDGVLTEDEIALGDTDSDRIEDYLDSDDDGDGVPTEDEWVLAIPMATVQTITSRTMTTMTECPPKMKSYSGH